ncbi:MAG: MFS transporter [Anaerolineae bacterium]|nr:MFS transporter [Thermoflexales bacterium]MDW8395384.1 MFS transporter [Anaerolineae bacterium]
MQPVLQSASEERVVQSPALLQEVAARYALEQLQQVIRLASLATTALVVALPLYSRNFNASGTETGLLFAIPAFTAAIARPIIGRSMDRIGRKPFLVAATVLMLIAMLTFAAAREFTVSLGGMVWQADARFAVNMLFAARTLQGFALGVLLLSSYTMTADLARQAGRGSSFGYTEEAQYRGGILGGLIALPVLLLLGFNVQGELIITQDVWTAVFSLFSLGTLISAIWAVQRVPETRQWALAQAEPLELSRTIDPQLFRLMAIVTLTMASSYGLSPFILVYINDRLTQNLIFIVLAYLPAALIWAFLPSRLGRIADRVGRKPPIVIGLSISGLFSLTIPFLAVLSPNPALAIGVLMVFATLEAACYSAAVPAEQALVADMTGGKHRGTGFGLYTLAQSVGQIIGPVAMGALYDIDHSGPFIANAVILALGSVLVLTLLRDPVKQRASRAA